MSTNNVVVTPKKRVLKTKSTSEVKIVAKKKVTIQLVPDVVAPEAPEAPKAPESLKAHETPEAPKAPEAPETLKAPESLKAPDVMAPVDVVAPKVVKQPKKRMSAAVKKAALLAEAADKVIQPVRILKSNIVDGAPDPVIVKVHVSKKCASNASDKNFNFEEKYYKYTPDIGVPVPFDSGDSSTFISRPLELNVDHFGATADFNMLNDVNNEWPTSSTACCYWCCHTFDGMPFGIPIKFVDNKFYLQGNFCSLECAAAYNFSNNNGKKWDVYHLITLFAIKCDIAGTIRCAPSPRILKMFGGNLSITEFRSVCKTTTTSTMISMLPYPIVSVTSQIEEISNCIKDVKFVPLDIEKLSKLEQTMYEKTLQSGSNTENIRNKMNVQIVPDDI